MIEAVATVGGSVLVSDRWADPAGGRAEREDLEDMSIARALAFRAELDGAIEAARRNRREADRKGLAAKRERLWRLEEERARLAAEIERIEREAAP